MTFSEYALILEACCEDKGIELKPQNLMDKNKFNQLVAMDEERQKCLA